MSAAVATAAEMFDPRLRAIGLALGDHGCRHCNGVGALYFGVQSCGRGGERDFGARLCGCTRRRIWRKCWFRAEIVEAVAWPRIKRTGAVTFSLPAQEYATDLWLVARRAILDAKRPDCLRVLELRCSGFDWKLGCRAARISKGLWFGRLYRAEEIAGQACLDASPYPLYPIDQYFTSRDIPLPPHARRRAILT